LTTIIRELPPNGTLIIKDIEPTPFWKTWFTWILDKMMDYRTPVHYWHPKDVVELLNSLGLRCFKHSLLDYLPYPHVIYIGNKRCEQP